MAFNSNITPGRPPLMWSEVYEAFEKVNENFEEIVSVTGLGITPVNFGTLHSNVSPATDNLYHLGSSAFKWRNLFVGEYDSTTSDAENGIWLGTSQIKGISGTVDLPANSTVNGSLIIDPDKTFFKEIQVDNNFNIVATQFSDSINVLSGNGINLVVNSSGDSIEINNTGILSITDGSGISHTTVSGVATITNTGVRSFTNVASLPSGRTQGAGINISSTTGDSIKITNTGVISISSGVGITVSADAATGDVTITNSAPAVNAFTQIEVNGDVSNRLAADAVSDVLNITSGQGITLTKNVATDTLTITVNPVFDLRGSVFGDDSAIIVDAIDHKVYASGGFIGNLTGTVTGSLVGNADSSTVASTVNITNTNGLTTVYYPTFVENRTTGQTVRADVDLTYRTDTNTLTASAFSGNLTGTVTGNIFTNLIDSADSSAITVTPATIFSSDVTVENDLDVTQRLRVQGSRVINISELKSLVAASTDFADFQARIAALV